MAEISQPKILDELDAVRDRHAKETEGLPPAEIVRFYKERAERARKELGLNLRPVDKARR